MINYTNRSDAIYVLGLDDTLLADMADRLSLEPRLQNGPIVLPNQGRSGLKVEHVEELAQGTMAARIIIFDIRSQTLPLLRGVYNKIVGYNRADFNRYCYSVLVGDGPPKLFAPGTRFDAFASHLAKFRVDFHPGAFFYDPFLHYSYEERVRLGLLSHFAIPEAVPERLDVGFKEENLSVGQIRLYFRAAGASAGTRREKIARRQETLARLFLKRLQQAFPNGQGQSSGGSQDLADCLSEAGYRFGAEPLPLHIYPLYFEEWIGDLLIKAQNPSKVTTVKWF